MPEVLTQVEREVQPPQTGFVRFCPRCGRNDRVGSLKDRHFAGGELCAGEIVTLEYALVNPERARLEREVIEAAKAEHEAVETYQGNSTMENWHAIAPAYDKRKAAVKALIDFESQQEK